MVDRTAEMTSWVGACTKIRRGGVSFSAYSNNHYGGLGAARIQLFRNLAAEIGLEIPVNVPAPQSANSTSSL